jgi:hypothetical protein
MRPRFSSILIEDGEKVIGVRTSRRPSARERVPRMFRECGLSGKTNQVAARGVRCTGRLEMFAAGPA